jgi:hypothetical protein
MASVPQAQGLPVLYRDLTPLSSLDHANYALRPMEDLSVIADIHAVPLTVDEFPVAQRCYPIVFSSGSDPVPLALMGLNEGVNVFVDAAGQLAPKTYLPAYVRRYPFMLAQLQPGAEEMSLCFDPSAGLVGEFEGGPRLFDGDQPSEQCKATLAFCEQFETAARRTGQFMTDLKATGLLEEGEVTINNPDFPQPYIYRGFQMVNEEKLRDLRGDQLRKMSGNGMLVLLYAHLFSMNLMTELFTAQQQQGKVPPQF